MAVESVTSGACGVVEAEVQEQAGLGVGGLGTRQHVPRDRRAAQNNALPSEPAYRRTGVMRFVRSRHNWRGVATESPPRTFRGLAAPHPGRNANQRPRKAADLQFSGADDGIRTRDPHLGKVILLESCERRELVLTASQPGEGDGVESYAGEVTTNSAKRLLR